MGNNKKINWFDFKETNITGWGYLLRFFVSQLLFLLIIPGFWLIASTTYKRARALDWGKEFSVITSVLMCILIPINLVIDEIESTDETLFLFTLPLTILHLVLLFKNGNKTTIPVDDQSTKSSNTDLEIPDQKNNLEIIDKIVENSSTNQYEVSNYSDSKAFDTNIETSWGGEEPSILTFFKKYISNKEKLVLKKVDTFKNNIFYAKEDSNQTGHIFIFFEEANEAIEKFKAIVEPHSNSEQFFNLKSDQVSSWISKYKSEIQSLNVEGCSIQLSKGVSLYRIDISLKNTFKWSEINSVNKDKTIIFSFPFTSPIENDLPEINFNFNLSESLMLTSIYFSILDGDVKSPLYESYYNEDEAKVFAHTEDFKSFWSYCHNYVFIDSVDPMQTELFKNIFDKLNSEFTLFDKLNLSYLLIQSPQETFTIVNDDISAISSKPRHSDRTSELLRLNKYFDIQDGEFILFSMMKKRMDEVKPYFNDFKSLEDLYDCMKNESNESAVELRKKLVGDLPLNLIDRPTNIKVAQEDNEAPFSNYSESTIENYNRAMEKLQSGNHQIAAVELEKVIEQDSFMLPAYYNLTAIKINFEQDYVGAIRILDKIINAKGYEKNPDKVYAGLFFNRGLAKSYLDREEAAITDFNESLKIDPEYTSCYGSRGCSLMNLNRNIEALEDFDKAISLGDKTFINYFNRGKCKQSLTKFSEALEDYNAAYELNPENDNVIMQRDLLQAMKDNGLMDQIEKLAESEDSNINIDQEKISFIYELLMRVSMADNKLDKKEALLIAASIHKMKELYQFEGKVKRAESLSFFSKSDEFSDDEKTSIIGLLISLISIDEVVTYSELSLVISFCLGLNLSMDNAEGIIDSICKNESLDKNTFYLYITEIYSSMNNEMSDQAEENYDLVDQILNLEQEKIAKKFKLLPLELKTEIFFATIVYDERRSLAREEANELNNQAWNKMENGAYDDALVDAKKSIETLSMSNNNDTIALIYYHLKNYDEAIKYADISIELDESRSDHYVTRAKIYTKLKKTDLAKIDLNKAIELDEENEEAKTLSESLESSLQNETLNSNLNDLKENVQDKAVIAKWTNSELDEYLKQSNKVNTKLLYSLREEYFEFEDNENFPEAIRKITQIIEQIPVLKGQSLVAYVDPSDMLNGILLEEMYFNRSQLYYKMNLYNEAKNDLIKAISTNPNRNEAQFHHNLGCALMQCGDFTSCIDQFNITLKIDPEFFDSYYMRAVAYTSDNSDLQDINLARNDLKVYLDKYPDDGAANKLLKIINS